MASGDNISCNFCGKEKANVEKLVKGENAYICEECVLLCLQIIEDDEKTFTAPLTKSIPTPKQIYNFLNQYIIGQEDAKKILSVAVHKHYKRTKSPNIDDDVELEKSNILLYGPTGSGKTHIVRTIARMLDVPMVIADATALTETGYVGDDVESIILKLYIQAGYNVDLTQRGIIYIDEIDKISRKTGMSTMTRDVGGEGVQQSLLKIIEGTTCSIPSDGSRGKSDAEFVDIDTTNILFIVGGAFEGLHEIVKERNKNKGSSIGFGSNIDSDTEMEKNLLLKSANTEDLHKFGLLQEFIGRVPMRACLTDLTDEEMIEVLTKPKNALVKQYQKMFNFEDIELEITNDGLGELVRQAKNEKTGARGLRSLLENTLIDIEFELPDYHESGVKKIVIDRDTILKMSAPKLIYKKSKKS